MGRPGRPGALRFCRTFASVIPVTLPAVIPAGQREHRSVTAARLQAV